MSTTVSISAADVNKLRQMTGAGMMDCKKALTESGGDFEAAIDYLRKKGQKVAVNRADREAREGVIIAQATSDGKRGAVISLNCETDFVAKNKDFVSFAESILNTALEKNPKTLDDLKKQTLTSGLTIEDALFDNIGKIGEKIDLSRYEMIEAPLVIVYNHPGYRLAAMVGLNNPSLKNINEIGKDVAMQIAAMSPVSIDKDDVDPKLLERELEIAKEQARTEGKPAEMLEKIAQGKLNKFYKESTLLNQQFIKDDKKTVAQYLAGADKQLRVTAIRRLQLGS